MKMRIYKYLIPAVSSIMFAGLCMNAASAEETAVNTVDNDPAVTEVSLDTAVPETTSVPAAETSAVESETTVSIPETSLPITTVPETTVPTSETTALTTAEIPADGWFTDSNEKKYYYENGIAVTGLREIDGELYLFSKNGAMKVGWHTVDGKRMFFDLKTGKNQTGWIEYMGNKYYADSETGKLTGRNQVDGITYMFSDKGIIYNGWFEIDGCKYYSDMKNGIYTGETAVNGIIYIFSQSGIYQTGWQEVGGKKIFFDYEKARPIYGWINYNGNIYYSDAYTGKYVGERRINNSLYRFTEKGNLLIGFQQFDDGMRYYDENGKIAKGFSELDGNTYYFGDDNLMQTGLITVKKHMYYFNENGVMQYGWQIIDKKKYYFGSDGKMSVGLTEIDGVKYMFNDEGVMQTGLVDINGVKYLFSDNGAMQTGLADINGKRYYFNSDGKMQYGWQVINNNRYYFGSDGAMVTGSVTIDGDVYNFGKDGLLINVLLGTPYLSQVGYPTGCESASAVMLLNDAGYNTTIDYFIDNALDIGWIEVSDGIWYGPDPNVAFIGDPRSEYGYGCYAPVITNALNRILTNGDTAVNVTGSEISQLLTDYIDKGTPVAIWATINMIEMRYTSDWILPDGSTFTWKGNEHCLVLVGYDKDYYYINDPYNSNGLMKYERSLVERRYSVMGSQAVVIQRKG